MKRYKISCLFNKVETALNHPNHQARQRDGNRKAIVIIFGLLLTWSLLIALGAMLRTEPFDFRKPLIVIGTMGVFLGIWLTAPLFRRLQTSRED